LRELRWRNDGCYVVATLRWSSLTVPMRNAESDETDKIVDLRFAEALRIAVCVGAVIPGANSSNHFPPMRHRQP